MLYFYIMAFYFLNIVEKMDSGLCNQIYNMAGMLDYAIEYNIKFLFIGKFLKQIYTQNICNSGEIFDFDLMNKYFGEKYGVYFFDGYTYTTKINIDYHTENEIINITDYVLDNFLDFDGNIFISQNTKFKNICRINDINNNSQNYINIQYFINNSEFNTKYNFKNFTIDQNISICISKQNLFINSKRNRQVHCRNPSYFMDFFVNIEFTPFIKNKSKTYFELLKQNYFIKVNEKINCIHLRLEEDMIVSLSNEEKINVEYCKKVLEDKYIFLIEKEFEKEDMIIILAHDYNNKVIDFLKNNGYKYILTDNLDENREISGTIDLYLGEISCNNMFIGYFQSTFSYVLFQKLKYKIKKIPFVTHYINETTNKEYYGLYAHIN